MNNDVSRMTDREKTRKILNVANFGDEPATNNCKNQPMGTVRPSNKENIVRQMDLSRSRQNPFLKL